MKPALLLLVALALPVSAYAAVDGHTVLAGPLHGSLLQAALVHVPDLSLPHGIEK